MKLEKGIIRVEIRSLKLEKILNELWVKGIRLTSVKKDDLVTAILEIDYLYFDDLKEVVKKYKGKYKVIRKKGVLFDLIKVKKKGALVLGIVVFFLVIFILSKFIWRVEINVEGPISPYEIRQELYNLGIKPGKYKGQIEVKELEKGLLNANSNILWVRARIEGSTLKVDMEEKVNPPEIREELPMGNLLAVREGEVKRIYAFSGRGKVQVGDYVNSGDVVIEGLDGKPEAEYVVPPVGVVIANTFYEKSMKVQIMGKKEERTGNKDSDIYMSINGKKIYLKKAIKGFEKYDKIEEDGKIFNKVVYYEKKEKEVDVNKEQLIEEATKKLEISMQKDLTRDAIIVDKILKLYEEDDYLVVNVVFVVEQNIASKIPVDY